MTTSYFKKFENIIYRFGDNEDPVLFNRLSQYVSVGEDVLNNDVLYNKYTILSGDRPDTLSYKLYGTTSYYWTFFLMNEHIRESGWPISTYDLLDETKSRYPYRTVTTNDDISSKFPVGQVVTGQSSGTSGTIIRKIPDMGQLVIDTGTEPNLINFSQTEQISYSDGDGNIQTAVLIKESEQFNSVHHYEDTDGIWQDLTLFDFGNPSVSWIPVTYRDRVERRNEQLKEIVVLKPSTVLGIANQFSRLMSQRL